MNVRHVCASHVIAPQLMAGPLEKYLSFMVSERSKQFRYWEDIMWSHTFVALLVGVTVSACQSPQTDASTDVSAEIGLANDQTRAAFAAHDAAALANRYTPDAQLLPPNNAFVTGQEAIQAYWQGVIDDGVVGVSLTVEEAIGTDDMAIEVGRYELSDADGSPIDEGKYIVWWQRTAAGWRLHRDIWNSSRPAP